MNNIPLLKSKLTVPEIPKRVLYSKRIRDLNIPGNRAVVITAPAGFGKTTAVLLSLQNNRSHICWYRMEKEDSFLAVFYAHLIETLFGSGTCRVANEETASAAESIRSLTSIGKISEDYPLINATICQDAWTFHPDTGENVYIVFDDFHNVAGTAAIVESIRYFITNMPPHFRIIVISRTETGVPTIRQAFSGNITLIDEQALRFTKEEVESLASKVFKLKLENESLNRIYALTEGWVTGIAMLSHTAGTVSDNSLKLSSAGDDNRAAFFRLFLDEVVGGSDKEMLKTLARISILPDFNESSLKSVFGMDNAGGVISSLERSNICIQKLNSNGACYRFHSLLQNALQSVLYELFTRDLIEDMNLKAAAYYENLGDLSMAVRFFITAGRTDEAVRIASAEGMRLMNLGDMEKIIPLIQYFTEDTIHGNPYLLLFRGASLINSDYEESYAYLFKALTAFRQKKNIDLQMNVVSLIISMCYKKNDMEYVKNISSMIPVTQALVKSGYSRKTLLLCATMSFAWTDRLRLAGITGALAKRYYFTEPLLSYMMNTARVALLFRTGRLDRAGEIIKRLMQNPMTMTNDRWRVLMLALHHNAVSHMGDMETSEKIVSELASIGEKYDSEYARYHAARLSAYNRYQARDVAGAIDLAENSANLFADYGNQILSSAMRLTQYLWQSEHDPPAPLAEKAAAELSKISLLKPGQGFLELCQAIAGVLHKEAGNGSEAERLLLEAYRTSKGKKAGLDVSGIAMQLADLYYKKGNRQLEEKYLRIWSELSSANNYVYFREMTYPALVRACARCMEKGIGREYAGSIIEKYFGRDASENLAENPAKASASPGDFISLFSHPAKGEKSIRVNLLGSFTITVDRVEIGEKEWKTRKICGILKYILASPGKTVSRETLAALFWPESDSKSAFTSLRAALYELRKTLARFGLSFESNDALITEGKNGFRFNSRAGLSVDADEFTTVYKEYKSGKTSPEKRKALLEKAVALYGGNFLEDDSYDDWVSLAREHYKSIFIECSHTLAGILLEAGGYERAEAVLERHMSIDPYDENACGMLVALYRDTGRSSQAASLKRQFSKRFEVEMGIKPEIN